MKRNLSRLALWLAATALLIASPVLSQEREPPSGSKRSIVFAVHAGPSGKWIEPIGSVRDEKIADVSTDGGGNDSFSAAYYKPKATYPLVFGGALVGSVSVVRSNVGAECGGSSADVAVKAPAAKLSGMVMGLATDLKISAQGASYRRRPTASERTDVERLVRREFIKQGASSTAARTLRYHNLTAVDVDRDDLPEFIGSYWIAPTTKERRLLFFVTAGNQAGDVELAYSDHSVVGPYDLMSGDLKDLDSGIGSELLVDLLDYDDDGVREIFTLRKAFEGNNYQVYKRENGKWTRVHETYVYRCAY